jgi:endonuclease/exonuclease/phosphatase (EEP) superfamily protein YafD
VSKNVAGGASLALVDAEWFVGVLALCATVLGLLGRYLPFINRPVLAAATMLPFLTLTGAFSVLPLGLVQCWPLAGAACAVTVAAIAIQIPLYVTDNAADTGIRLEVMSANLRLGEADAESLVSFVRDSVEILAVQELTACEVNRLSVAGLDDLLPNRLIDLRRPRSYGIGLWSKYPLSPLPALGGNHLPFLAATIQVPAVKAMPIVVVAHVANPWHIRWWSDDIQKLANTLRQVGQLTDGTALIVGDMNSTLDMRPFRDLLREGYRDAAEQAGAGFCPTFPDNMYIPPLFAIDHILTLRCVAVAAHTVSVPGSDHRALRATIVLPDIVDL